MVAAMDPKPTLAAQVDIYAVVEEEIDCGDVRGIAGGYATPVPVALTDSRSSARSSVIRRLAGTTHGSAAGARSRGGGRDGGMLDRQGGSPHTRRWTRPVVTPKQPVVGFPANAGGAAASGGLSPANERFGTGGATAETRSRPCTATNQQDDAAGPAADRVRRTATRRPSGTRGGRSRPALRAFDLFPPLADAYNRWQFRALRSTQERCTRCTNRWMPV